jgi:DNA-binding IclR family transcriptional regulator
MQSLKTGLKILSEFSHVDGELSVTELANRLGMTKSQVSRMLAAFRDEGWVVQNPGTRAFSIGIAAYAVGARFIHSNRLTREALPVMRTVVDRCGFTTTLCVLDDAQPLYLLGIDGPISVDFASRVGAYFPFHAAAPGKLLAAFADKALQSAMLTRQLASLTARTIVDGAALRKELRDIRARGFACSSGERVTGIGGVCVPVFDGASSCVASLGIVYPESLVQPDEFAAYAAILHKAAGTLSRRLGCESYPIEIREPDLPPRIRTPIQPAHGNEPS